jgi:hypothetical protein
MPTFGLCIIDTDSYKLANNAFNVSASKFKFDKHYILTDQPKLFANPAQTVLVDKIKKVSDYNELVVKFLPEVVDVDYLLIVQFDGFILNEKEWSNIFLHYDYIGAPWPLNTFSELNVGNGGFSLRSRKLIQACRDLPYDNTIAEDVFVARHSRVYLEMEKAVRFASAGVASHFSVEDVPVPYPTFGFHGLHHLPRLYRKNIDYLIENLPVRALRNEVLQRAVLKTGPTARALLQRRLSQLALDEGIGRS